MKYSDLNTWLDLKNILGKGGEGGKFVSIKCFKKHLE
jgi:hypothetical protein